MRVLGLWITCLACAVLYLSVDYCISAHAQTMVAPSQIRALPPEAAQLLSGSAGLDFAPISPRSCREMTFRLAGAVVNDAVSPGWPPTLPVGLIGSMRVGTADMIVVAMCNVTQSTIDPAPHPFSARIVRGY